MGVLTDLKEYSKDSKDYYESHWANDKKSGKGNLSF
jgi:hypothetical protein